jgi:hypothetical protein
MRFRMFVVGWCLLAGEVAFGQTQSTEDRLGSDAVTEGKLMPMAVCSD